MKSAKKIISPLNTSGSFSFGNFFFQPKLTINNPNDKYEEEADAIADKIMRTATPELQSKTENNSFYSPFPLLITAVQRKCAHCEGEEEKKMQRKEMDDTQTAADNNLENYVGSLNNGGQSLPNEVRNFYEPRFGYDFSKVKIHTDAIAAKSAQSINALAYTSGNNVVFNSGQYAPNSDSGKRLLGHELTHVVQNREHVNNPLRTKKFSSTGRANEDTPAIINDVVIKSDLLTKYVGADRIKAAFLNAENFNVIQEYELEEYGKKCKQGDIRDKAGGFFCRDVKEVKDKKLRGDIFVVRYLKLGYVMHEFIHKLSGPLVKNMLGTFVNEGITQYFTDLFLREGQYDILTDHGYKDNLACANKIVSQTSEAIVAKAYFDNNSKLISDLQKLLNLKKFEDVNPYFNQHQCIAG